MDRIFPAGFFAAAQETAVMVFVSWFLAIIFGLPLGFFLFLANNKTSSRIGFMRYVSNLLGGFFVRLPIPILLILTWSIFQPSWGRIPKHWIAIAPLCVVSTAFCARKIEEALRKIDIRKFDLAAAVGLSEKQMIKEILFPEVFPTLIGEVANTAILTIEGAVIAGLIGYGGIGALIVSHRGEPIVVFCLGLEIVLLLQIIETVARLVARRLKF